MDDTAQIPDSDADVLAELALSGRPRQRASAEDSRPTVLRELTPADLAMLASGERRGNALAPQPLVALTYAHHAAARMIAEGMSNVEVSFATGYHPQRISGLRQDPAFAELVAHYASRVEAKYLDTHARLGAVGMLAVDRIAERLSDDLTAATLSVKTLREVAEMALDRSIAPSVRAGTTVNVGGAPAGAQSGLSININFGEAPNAPQTPTLDLTPNAAPTPNGGVSPDDD